MMFCSINIGATEYQRNQAVPVEKVLFGTVISVRNITEQELQRDKDNGWQVFGGALMGGVIGHQFGSGSGRDVATILGAIIGASIASDKTSKHRKKIYRLVELMIKIDNGDEYMVVQDRDAKMLFHPSDNIRMIYLANGSVRIDKQL
jgi:outer membrane lipoprotein SlyB